MDDAETHVPTDADAVEENPDYRAVHVEYQKFTSAESAIIGTLSSRGFRLLSYGTADAVASNRAFLTILFGQCDERAFGNAIRQIEKIVTVIKAARRSLEKVTQDLHARVLGLTGEEMRTLRNEYGANLHSTALFRIPERGARRITRGLHETGAKIAKAKREPLPDGDANHSLLLKVRMENPSSAVAMKVQEYGGTFRNMDYVRLTADVLHVQRLADHIRSSLLEKVEYMSVSAPRASLREDDEE